MSWQIYFTKNHQQTGDCCLQLTNSFSNYNLRSWSGPFASHLFDSIKPKLNTADTNNGSVTIDKQFVQYLLIKASFLHQKCMYEYQVTSDLSKTIGLNDIHEMAEILLYIRMTEKHPCLESLIHFAEQQIPWCNDIHSAIEALLDHKLIQQIKYHRWCFFDKNPYPHNHLLDMETNCLVDHHHQMTIDNNQRLIVCSPV